MKSWKWQNLKELVESLTVNEKRYFKLFIDESKSKNYLKLFDALNSKTDEKKFKKDMAKAGVNVSYEKSYLIKVLLRNLRNFHESQTFNSIFHQALIDIEILMDKKLLTFCNEFIDYYIELAKEYENFIFLLQLLKWKRKCIIRMGDAQKQKNFIEEEWEMEEDCLIKIRNIAQIKRLQQKMLVIINQKGNTIQSEEKRLMTEILSDPIMADKNNALSIHAKLMYFEIKIWGLFYQGQYEVAFEYSSQLIAEIELYPFIKVAYPQIYFAALANHFSRAYRLDKTEILDDILEKIEQMSVQKGGYFTDDNKNEAIAFVMERRLLIAADENDYSKTIAIFNANKKNFTGKKLKFKPSFYILQYYFAAFAYFHLKDYTKSIKYIRAIMDNYDDTVRFDFILYTRILNVLVQFQLGNNNLLPHLIKSIDRLLIKNKTEVKVYPVTCHLIKQLSEKNPNAREKQELINQYLKELELLNKEDTEEMFIGNLGLKAWAESLL